MIDPCPGCGRGGPEYVPLAEASRLMGLSIHKIIELARDGELKAYRGGAGPREQGRRGVRGSRVWVSVGSIREFIEFHSLDRDP